MFFGGGRIQKSRSANFSPRWHRNWVGPGWAGEGHFQKCPFEAPQKTPQDPRGPQGSPGPAQWPQGALGGSRRKPQERPENTQSRRRELAFSTCTKKCIPWAPQERTQEAPRRPQGAPRGPERTPEEAPQRPPRDPHRTPMVPRASPASLS